MLVGNRSSWKQIRHRIIALEVQVYQGIVMPAYAHRGQLKRKSQIQ